MNEYIKNLQSKPESARKQVLLGALIASMSLVAVVWFYSLGNKFGEKASAPEQASSDIKPFKLFATSVGNTFHNIGASVGNIFSKKQVVTGGDKQIDLIVVEHPANQ